MPNLELEPQELSAARKLTMATWRGANDPTMYASVEVTMDGALDYAREFREATGRRLTVTHLTARAVAEVLRRAPETNALLRRGRIYRRKRIALSMPVTMTEKNADGTERVDLAAVNLYDVADKSLAQIVDEIAEKISAVRKREDVHQERSRRFFTYIPCLLIKIMLRLFTFVAITLNLDLSRFGIPRDPFGSVIVTNVGSIGLDMGLAPLVPYSRVPIVFCIGAVQPRPVVEGDQIVIRQRMTITITADHRLIDGFHLSLMFGTLREWLERPQQSFGPIPRGTEAT
jgi:pyruvate/2-oxoglutarate dehydrogenase complex dihydrolipoamide acyltransferase (E2) component